MKSHPKYSITQFPGLLITLLTVLVLFSSCSPKHNSNSSSSPYIVMLSIDGCRWDYPDRAEMPHLDSMAVWGVKAVSLIPSYPSKTFPNHYTIATGLYPDHHGIVQNNFYDPVMKKRFSIGNRSAVRDSTFWGGEPIWETAEKQGVKTASFYWVGTETDAYYKPSITKYFDSSVPFDDRVDTVISWLYLPEEERPHLILYYFEEPDGVGHKYGPESNETNQMLTCLDSLIGVSISGFEKAERDLDIAINFIVTSDHGMGYIAPDHYLFLEDYFNMDQVDGIAGGNPVWLIQPATGQKEKLLQSLSAVPHLKVWEKSKVPVRYHYGTNRRIFDLVVEADPGWGVVVKRKKKGYSLGAHGYDPANPDMHAVFYAMGPAFKTGYLQPAFENVDIYPLLTYILKIKPVQTDGSLEPVRGMLAH